MITLKTHVWVIFFSLWSGLVYGQVVSESNGTVNGASAQARVGAEIKRTNGIMSKAVAGQRLRYQIIYPDKTVSAVEGYPVLLFLHGAGERGSDLNLVSTHGPPKVIAAGTHEAHPLRQAILITPQCPKGEWWQSETLVALLEEAISSSHLKIDRRRLYVSGLSMGGFGVWKLIKDYPDLFAAAVPVCGGYDVSDVRTPLGLAGYEKFSFGFQEIASAKMLPIWTTHGAEDRIVLPIQTRQLVTHLKQVGNERVHWIEYPGVGHDSWTRTYQDPKMYKWLFAQVRPESAENGRRHPQ